ncbi:MAG: DNA polymerase I [Tidjanibacter sp.]|nr:DNA polymerase I [Tidjanibacter sp.]
MEKLFLVDAYAQIFRAYYAFAGRPMRNREGLNTSPIFGFTKFLRDIIVNERPHYLGVAFDPHGGNFRNQLFPDYKANRSETPEDIIAAVPYIKEILKAMRIPILEVAGYEADDVIGTLSHKAAAAGYDVYMVTPDKDFGQLVGPTVRIYKQRKGGEGVEIVGPAEIKEHYGFDDPRKVIDILALWGDASDNIPGVKGVGEKGAIKLVNEFGTVEEILADTARLKGKQRENVEAGAEQLRLSKVLATISLDAPIEFVPSELAMCAPDCEALREIYRRLDFNMFLREMELSAHSPFNGMVCPEASAVGRVEPAKEEPPQSAQPSQPVATDLFGNPIEAPKQPAPASATPSEPSLGGDFDLFSQATPLYQTIDTVEHSYTLVDTPELLSQVVEKLSEAPLLSFDTETSGLDYHTDHVVGIGLAATPHEAFYVPMGPDNRTEVLAALRPLLENEAIEKVGQNVKFDLLMLRREGVEVGGKLWDTMIMHYLIDPESRHGMNHLAQTLLGYQPIEIETLIGRGAKQLTMDRVAVADVAPYCSEDADITLQLYHTLLPKLSEVGALELYNSIEEPLIRTLADMEWEGVKVDVAQLADYGRELGVQLATLESEIRSLAGMPDLNVNSSRQLGIALFEVLKIDSKPKRTKTKQYSTEEEYLQFLSDRHPIVPKILEYRGTKKLLSTYVEALPALVNPATGRIHTSYNQAVAATGRLSSTNPNLQNIPVRDDQGRRIREAFVASDSDHILLAADYSQVELRLMAHMSGDKAMIEAFRSGEDIHRDTASRLFHVATAEVTSDQRRKAKTANFGIIYGISAFGLRQRMGNEMSMGEAKAIIDGYFASYPAVKEYIDRTIAEAKNNGFVQTIFGRKRYLPDINSANANVRSLAERNAINAPLQGSAADIIKIAMAEVARRLKAEGLRSKMILQVHDELIVDTLVSEKAKVEKILREAMEGAAQLAIPLVVDVGEGANWLEAH